MVFSLFRSRKTVDELTKDAPRRVDPKTVAPPPAKPDEPEQPAPAKSKNKDLAAALDFVEQGDFAPDDVVPLEFDLGDRHDGMPDGAIEVVENTEAVDPLIEQAVMLFANDQPRETVALLEDVVLHDPGARLELWLMLLELYALESMKGPFDDLAVKFVEKFKRSPPDWDQVRLHLSTVDASVQAEKSGSAYFALTGTLTDESLRKQLEQFAKVDEKKQPVRVEFAKILDLDADAARVLLEWMVSKTRSPRQWQGLPVLAGKLADRCEAMNPDAARQPFWLLRLETLQMLGRQEEFENLAVDFAVTYEVSPPSWDERKVIKEPVAATGGAKEAGSGDEDVFVLEGVIADGQEAQLTAVRKYAEGRNHLYIDMQKVARMDFSCAGWLLNMLIAFQTDGKKTTITGASELIIGLFRVLGITELAQVVRRR